MFLYEFHYSTGGNLKEDLIHVSMMGEDLNMRYALFIFWFAVWARMVLVILCLVCDVVCVCVCVRVFNYDWFLYCPSHISFF